MSELLTEQEEAQRKFGWRIAVTLDPNGKDWRCRWECWRYGLWDYVKPISTYQLIEKTWRNHRAAKRAAKRAMAKKRKELNKESIRRDAIYVY